MNLPLRWDLYHAQLDQTTALRRITRVRVMQPQCRPIS